MAETSRFEQACAKACQWCEARYERYVYSYYAGHYVKSETSPIEGARAEIQSSKPTGRWMVDCTGPLVSEWAESESAAREALQQQVEALEADKRRLGYLIDQLSPSLYPDLGRHGLDQIARAMRSVRSGEQTAQAIKTIDAAMAEARAGEGGK